MARIQPEESCPCGTGESFGACHGKRLREASAPPSRRISLHVIPEPDPGSRTLFKNTGLTSVFFSGNGSDALDCGACGAPLAVGVRRQSFASIVLKCNQCGAFNDTSMGAMPLSES